jgi:hypothetical protein
MRLAMRACAMLIWRGSRKRFFPPPAHFFLAEMQFGAPAAAVVTAYWNSEKHGCGRM